MQDSSALIIFLPLALGVIMLGLGLSLTTEDFRNVLQKPKAVIVALNLGAQPQRLALPNWAHGCRLLLSTLADPAPVQDGALFLRPNDGAILTLAD